MPKYSSGGCCQATTIAIRACAGVWIDDYMHNSSEAMLGLGTQKIIELPLHMKGDLITCPS